jgi:hypothetical protein
MSPTLARRATPGKRLPRSRWGWSANWQTTFGALIITTNPAARWARLIGDQSAAFKFNRPRRFFRVRVGLTRHPIGMEVAK